VEIPKSAGRGSSSKRKKCGGGGEGPCCDGEEASCAVESGNREGHRVLLLARAIDQLKALRRAYDDRAAEVVRLALQHQLLGSASVGAGRQPGQPPAPAAQYAGQPSSAAAAVSSMPTAFGQQQPGPPGATPMMMLMPVWVPAGCAAVAPQVVPMSAEMMALFAGTPPPPAHDHSHAACPSGKEPDACDCGPCSSTPNKEVAQV